MQKISKKAVALTSGAPWKVILRFAVPMFIGSLFQQLYHTVDTLMVGRLVGERALSGVGTCGVLTNLFIALSTGFSAGAGIVAARQYGAERYDRLADTAKSAVLCLMAMGAVTAAVGLVWGEPILRALLSVPETLVPYASEYFRICAVGFLFQFLYNGAAALLRSIGDSRASLYFLLLSSVSNILLDYIFIGLMDMGVAGAAWATVLSQVAACAAVFAYMRRYEALRFWGRGKAGVKREDWLEILKTGAPMAFQSMSGTVFNLMIQRLVNTFGEAMTASYAVVSRVEGYMNLPTSTLYQALPTYTAQNIGAGEEERVSIGLRHTIIMAVSVTAFISAASYIFAPMIPAAFGIEGQSAAYCLAHIRWLSLPILFFALYFPCTGLYQGAGKGMVSTGLSVFYLTLCLSLAYILRAIPAINYKALFVCKPLSWAITAGVNYIYYFKGSWREGMKYSGR